MAKLIEITGKALSGEWGTDDETGDGIPVLRTTNFTNEGVVDYRNVVTRTIIKKKIEEKYLRKGDIIIEKSGGSDKQPVGRVIFFDGPEQTYLFNNFTGLLRVKDQTTWYPRYVFYSMYSNYRRGGTRAFENKTTGLHNLKTDDYVSRYEVSVTSMENQMEICERLDRLYGIIKMRQQELQKLDELIKARFVELFGSIYDNKFGYNVRTLQDVCEPIKDGTHQTPAYIDDSINGFKFLSSKDVTTGKIDWNHLKYIPEELHNKLYKRISPRKGDILLAKNGTTGVAAIVDKDEVFDIYVSLALLRPLDIVASEYLCSAINSTETKKQFDGSLKGIGVPNLHLGEIKKTQIIVPPIELQNQFVAFVAQVDKSKFKEKVCYIRLRILRIRRRQRLLLMK